MLALDVTREAPLLEVCLGAARPVALVPFEVLAKKEIISLFS